MTFGAKASEMLRTRSREVTFVVFSKQLFGNFNDDDDRIAAETVAIQGLTTPTRRPARAQDRSV